MATLLIDIDTIRKYKELSDNTALDAKVRSAIFEAQEFDLRPVIGEQLYLDILANESAGFGIYADLMNGCNYTYSSRQYHHEGLKAVLAYYAYSRIIPALDENATPYGFVQKNNEFSVPVSAAKIAAKVSQAVSGAQALQARCIEYLIRNSTTFPLWYGNSSKAKSGNFRIHAVGGKQKVGSSYRCRGCGKYSCTCHLYHGDSADQFT